MSSLVLLALLVGLARTGAATMMELADATLVLHVPLSWIQGYALIDVPWVGSGHADVTRTSIANLPAGLFAIERSSTFEEAVEPVQFVTVNDVTNREGSFRFDGGGKGGGPMNLASAGGVMFCLLGGYPPDQCFQTTYLPLTDSFGVNGPAIPIAQRLSGPLQGAEWTTGTVCIGTNCRKGKPFDGKSVTLVTAQVFDWDIETPPVWGHFGLLHLRFVPVPPALTTRPRPPLCPGGDFRVEPAASPLLVGGLVRVPDRISVGDDATVSIASGCPAVPARLKASSKGTSLAAKWDRKTGACIDDASGKASLKAALTPDCRTLSGVFKAEGTKTTFAATREFPEACAPELPDVAAAPADLLGAKPTDRFGIATQGIDFGELCHVSPPATAAEIEADMGDKCRQLNSLNLERPDPGSVRFWQQGSEPMATCVRGDGVYQVSVFCPNLCF